MSSRMLVDLMKLAADAERNAVTDAEAELRAAEDESARLRAWKRAYEASAPVREAAKAWQPLLTEAVSAVESWLAAASGEHLLLRGGVGCGKTSSACVAVKRWTEPSLADFKNGAQLGGSVCWLRPDDLISATLHAYDESAKKIRKKVIVDDIGVESKPGMNEALCALLDMPGLTILMTTNLSKQDFRARYDLRVIDRLRDTTIPVDLRGESMRRKSEHY